MELDDYKRNKNKEIFSEISVSGAKNDPLQNLVEEMKIKDRQERKALLYLVVVFGMFVILYIAVMRTHEGLLRAGYSLLAGGFMLSFLHFFIKYLKQKRVSYASPTLVFLMDAEKRYAYWPRQDRIIDIPLVLITGLGGGLIVYSSFVEYFSGSLIPVAIFSVVYITAFLVGYRVGRKQWKKHKRSVYEKIHRLRQDFSGEKKLFY